MSARTLDLTEPVRDYLLAHGVREPEVLVRLRQRTAALTQAGMQICPEQGALMAVLVRLMGARRLLEVGTFTGYSALAMALALPSDGHLTCCDISEEWTAIGREFWEEAGVAQRIDLRLGPALDTLDELIAQGGAGTYDLAFVDADKQNYLAYHERCVELVRRGGALLYDNVLWGGSVAKADDERPDTVAIRALNTRLRQDDRVEIAMVPIGDGLTICYRR